MKGKQLTSPTVPRPFLFSLFVQKKNLFSPIPLAFSSWPGRSVVKLKPFWYQKEKAQSDVTGGPLSSYIDGPVIVKEKEK